MQQPNHIDDFFKKKLEQREFKFDPSHWEGASKMIDTQEQWKFWKNFAWASVSVVLFFTGGIGGYYFSQADQANTLPTQSNTPAVVAATPQASTSTDAGTIHLAEATSKNNNNSTTNTITTLNTAVADITSATSVNATRTSTSLTTSSQPSITLQNSTAATTTATSGALAKQSITVSQADVISKIETSEAEAILKPTNQSAEFATAVNALHVLPLNLLTSQQALPKIIGHPAIGEQPQRAFSMGLTAAGVQYPVGGQFTGWKAGLTFKYRLRPQLSLNADLLYHYRPGDYSSQIIATNTTFRFGSTVEEYALQAKHLNYIELPVYLQYQLGKHGFEAGMGLNYLGGVMGQVSKLVDLDQPGLAPQQVMLSEGWIDEVGYKPLTSNVLLGYQLHLTNDFTIGLRANYILGGIERLSAMTNIQVKEQPKLSFNVNARWYIF